VFNIVKTIIKAFFGPSLWKVGSLALWSIVFLNCSTHSRSNSQNKFRSHGIDRAAEQEICSRACKKASSCSVLSGTLAATPETPAFSSLECTNSCSSSGASRSPILAAANDELHTQSIPILGDCLKLDECTAFWACASQSGSGSQLAFLQSDSTKCVQLCERLDSCLSDCNRADSDNECDHHASDSLDDPELRIDQCMLECTGQNDQVAANQLDAPRETSGIECLSIPRCDSFLDCVEANSGDASERVLSLDTNFQIPGVAQVCIDICQSAESCKPKNGILQGYSIADPVDASAEEWVECAVQCQQDLQLASQEDHHSQSGANTDTKRESRMVECLASEDCSDFQRCVEKL